MCLHLEFYYILPVYIGAGDYRANDRHHPLQRTLAAFLHGALRVYCALILLQLHRPIGIFCNLNSMCGCGHGTRCVCSGGVTSSATCGQVVVDNGQRWVSLVITMK